MDNGCSAAVFKNICGGILSCDSDPAGVNLCLESVSGNLRIENVERIFAVKLFELEIVVKIEQLNALLNTDIDNHLYILYRAVKALCSGASVLGKIRHGNIFAAYLLIGCDDRLCI